MFTDNEIIKGLECADEKHMIDSETYEIMPNGKSNDEFSCDEWLGLDLSDLINLLQKLIDSFAP